MQATASEMFTQGVMVFFAYMLADAVWHANKKSREEYRALLKTVYCSGWQNYLGAFLILFMTLVVAVSLSDIVPTVLNKGWVHWFGEIDANPTVLALKEPQNANSQISIWPFVLAFSYLILLLLAIPLVTHREEKWFRKHKLRWWPITWNSVLFGMMHLVLGVPVILALCLIIPGFIFALHYRQVYYQNYQATRSSTTSHHAALNASTALHGIYNTWIVAIIMASTVGYSVYQ